MNQRRSSKIDVHGWVVLDKPYNMTSTQAVGAVRRIFNAKKGGHAGTLDPLATGLLPIALGEATKTVPYVVDGRKTYRFTVRWGGETTTDDTEGEVVKSSDLRPAREAIEALLPRYIGRIMQVPPKFSAIKIDGERAYDLAREGADIEMQAREIEIDALRLTAMDADSATFEADCGKGTYVRSLARDFGRDLGCYGHVIELRRTRVGPFVEAEAITLAELEQLGAGEMAGHTLADGLMAIESALEELPEVKVTRDAASRLMRGQSCIIRGRDAPEGGICWVTAGGDLIAIADVDHGEIIPKRVFTAGLSL